MSNTTISVPPSDAAQKARLFQDQPDILSQMEDFDLFNSLEWSFDVNIPLTWP
jgi:hypothetical protein